MKSACALPAGALCLALLAGCQPSPPATSPMNAKPVSAAPSTPGTAASPTPAQVTRTDEEWRQRLTPEQYRVLRQAGTERAFGPAYEEFKRQGAGTYVCAGCDAVLFSSRERFDSHCGWPSFYDPANATNVVIREDFTLGMARVEVLCAVCGGHLGHVFKGEGFPTPTDKRYCINGVSLKFVPAGTKGTGGAGGRDGQP